METLNDRQKAAATTASGPVAIVAGPGTGKTKTLAARIAFLIEQGVRPANILALTFTTKAADEMRSRVAQLGQAPPYIATFHGLCFDLIRQKTGESPRIIDEPARLALIKSLTKPATFKGVPTRELGLLISRIKNLALAADTDATTLVARYNAALAAEQLCDFDDVLLRTRDMLAADKAWQKAVSAKFTHILVDEFQDTNALQYQLLQLLRQNDNVFVIGDPQQSIYGFRGAGGDVFARFLAEFAQATHIVLDTNYRSAPQIVSLANAVYPDEPALLPHMRAAGTVQTIEVLNEYSEANWVLSEIQKSIGGSDLMAAVSDDQRADHHDLNDIAVLYRSRKVARAVQKTLDDSGIPVQVVGEGSPYETPAVQTIIKVMANLADPARNAEIKDVTAAQMAALLQKYDRQELPLAIAERIIADFGMTIDSNTRQLLAMLVQHKTLPGAVAYLDQLAANQFYDPRAAAITLLTIHAAKGLEFPLVFLVGAEEGVLPSNRGDEAEEKRLFYVAITRAKERIDILHARIRGGEKTAPSRFVTSVNPAILPRRVDPALVADQRRAQKRAAKRAQTSLF